MHDHYSGDHDADDLEGDIHFDDNDEDNIFARSLMVDDSSSLAMASAQDILKPQINEVLQCLDTLKSKTRIQRATKLLNNLANELHLELRTSGVKCNIDSCRKVNMNVEENTSRKSIKYASKNC
jgi:hypothetical protein